MATSILKLSIAVALLAASGCASGDLPPLATDGHEKPIYQLASGDRVRITVFGEEELGGEYTLSSSGDIAFPLLGDVPARGLSASELQETLRSQLGEGYLNEPRVTVQVLTYRPVYVLGEVSRSGDYAFADDLTVLQAVALAGGFTYRADRRRVFIRHAGAERELTYELEDGRAVFVRPGDTIRVGERYL